MSAAQNAEVKPGLSAGDHSPVFSCTDTEGGVFDFYVEVKGKPILLLFCGDKDLRELKEELLDKNIIDEEKAQIITLMCGDKSKARAQKALSDWPFRTVVDTDDEITSGFANLSNIPSPSIYVLDPNQRIVGMRSIGEAGEDLKEWLDANISKATFSDPPQPVKRAVPVLFVPRVLELEDCDWLIDLWREGEKIEGQVALGSAAKDKRGVVKDIKRREDFIVEKPDHQQRILNTVMPRLVPELKKVLHFHDWGMEALRIGCYKAEDAGFFNVHRDNCNPSVANRKYAITINLNTGDYEGGDLRFPEYGQELFRPPKGGAIVFSCSMLHEVLPVTKGERYTLLTFLTEPRS